METLFLFRQQRNNFLCDLNHQLTYNFLRDKMKVYVLFA